MEFYRFKKLVKEAHKSKSSVDEMLALVQKEDKEGNKNDNKKVNNR